jgi:8-oxo-dGTP pyrophosphatase MutT (NUDIX family)
VAGHIEYKEDIKTAAIRETFEETGLHIKEKDLFKLGIYSSVSNHSNIIDKEFHHTYILKIDEDKINLNYKNDEVDDLKLISLDKMDFLLNQNNRDIFIGKNKNYYKDVFEAILEMTKENYQ